MKLRHIKIERFRGIRELEWRVGGHFVCLVRPGDTTKTTILDAIEFGLSPRWNIPFDDSDFYDADTTAPIVITVTVGNFSRSLRAMPSTGIWRGAGRPMVIFTTNQWRRFKGGLGRF